MIEHRFALPSCHHARWQLVLVGLWSLTSVACASVGGKLRAKGRAEETAGHSTIALQLLQRAAAADPRDASGHAALGRLETKLGWPGAALRELEHAERLGDRSVEDELAELYLARAAVGAQLCHRERWRDLERARALTPAKVGARDFEAALLDGGLGRWRAGDRGGAVSLWRRIPTLADTAETAKDYERAVRLRRSNSVAPACIARLGDPEPAEVGARVVMALDGWLAGERDDWWDDELGAEVVVAAAGRRLEDWPDWLRPSVLRLRGDQGGAASARAAFVPASAPAEGWRVVAFERALAGEPAGAETVSAVDAPSALAAMTLARLAGDDAAGEEALALVAATPPGALALLRRLELGALADRSVAGVAVNLIATTLARWRSALPAAPSRWAALGDRAAVLEMLPGTGVLPLGSWRAHPHTGADVCGDASGSLGAALFAPIDGADFDRLARVAVDRGVSAFCNGFAVVAALDRAGDVRREEAWLDELLREEPTDGRALFLAFKAAAEAGDAPRALVFLTAAEASAPARGIASTAAVGVLVRAGKPLDAMAAARQAVALTFGSRHVRALEALATASILAGREGEGQRAFEAAAGTLSPGGRQQARWRIAVAVATGGGGRLVPWLRAGPEEAESPGGALARSPWSISALAQRAGALPVGSPIRAALEEDLLLLGLANDDARGALALEAFAMLVAFGGGRALGDAARREASRL